VTGILSVSSIFVDKSFFILQIILKKKKRKKKERKRKKGKEKKRKRKKKKRKRGNKRISIKAPCNNTNLVHTFQAWPSYFLN
jgi:hypothetical protein